MELKSLRVKIYDTEYSLKGEDEELMQEAANYVDSLMNEFSSKIPKQTPSTIAVLTALNIAEEFLKFKNLNQQSCNVIKEEMDSLNKQISLFLDLTDEETIEETI
jgi:cell division protein ZapA